MMPTGEKEFIIKRLQQFSHPLLPSDWADTLLRIKGGQAQVVVPFASQALCRELQAWLGEQQDLPAIEVKQSIAPLSVAGKTPIVGVKNLLVIFSNKGGVGKSATAVNLALALQQQGAKVGLLDADIYGPSLPTMLGSQAQTPQSQDGKMMEPVMAHGLATNSIGYLVPDAEAMVWRGPMAAKAFSQLVNETHWGGLDYLVVDMPPGTGDIQLSLAQQFPVTAAIVVTTPQDLALIDALKGVVMFNKVKVPVLGVVENMSYHVCSRCGQHEAIFGEGGAATLAKEQGIALLGQIPLASAIRQDIDGGTPTVVASPDSEHAKRYQALAAEVASRLYWQGEEQLEQIAVQLV